LCPLFLKAHQLRRTVHSVYQQAAIRRGANAPDIAGHGEEFVTRAALLEVVDVYLVVLDLPMLSVTDSVVRLGLHVHVPMVITH
jgi:hypothetical protein